MKYNGAVGNRIKRRERERVIAKIIILKEQKNICLLENSIIQSND